MTTRTQRIVALTAMALWLVVAGYAVRELIVDDGDDWEIAYAVLATAAPIAAALTVTVGGSLTPGAERSALRVAGLVLGALGCAFAAIAAWATPLWMPLLGAGLLLLAFATRGGARRPLLLLAAAMAGGIAAQFGGIAITAGEDGPADAALIVAGVTAATVLLSMVRHAADADGVGDLAPPRGVVAAES